MSVRDERALRRLHHDLRSPLVVISGFARLLASDRPVADADRRDYAQRIERAAEELRRRLDASAGA